jgi:hypothetical protein
MATVVNSESSLRAFWDKLCDEFARSKYLKISISTRKNRTLNQNALWAAMYQRISDTIGDGSAMDVAQIKAEAKLICGVPILRRDRPDFADGWQDFFASRSYEWQLKMMGPNPLFGENGFPVTSLFNTAQGAEYTKAIEFFYSNFGVNFSDIFNGV